METPTKREIYYICLEPSTENRSYFNDNKLEVIGLIAKLCETQHFHLCKLEFGEKSVQLGFEPVGSLRGIPKGFLQDSCLQAVLKASGHFWNEDNIWVKHI